MRRFLEILLTVPVSSLFFVLFFPYSFSALLIRLICAARISELCQIRIILFGVGNETRLRAQKDKKEFNPLHGPLRATKTWL